MEWTNRVLIQMKNSLLNEDLWVSIGEGFLKIILIILVAAMIIKIGKKIIQNFVKLREKGPIRISERRENTLLKLLQNVLTYVVYFIAFIMILEIVHIDVRALLAGAGIVGLAVGFGAQNLVKDIITGFFIIFEDQFSVGDYIRTGTFEGYVEEIGLRTTKIKSWTGELHILPNGSIVELTNFSIHNSVAVVDVSIAYEGKIEEAERVIKELLTEMPTRYVEMTEPPELLGIQTLGSSEVVLRITCETVPMKHWFIGRSIRKEVKNRLDEAGIEIPFPRLVLYNREPKQNGHASN
ncbi:MAG: mechanosensitive ion channel family protein [Bacillota bacterium]|uniref:mechanosensitive ion channel family protein n=1 Tax=Bacillus sp. RO2 TaxID=2723913 RepID=UPI00145E4A87|nr:mechanosensitive ion channel family protein [Bacillus sp. RO2]MEA3321530.1 mechanosensitive ion channel family protein [Bacillota bacterium]NMH72556.1 mechanosensitive ion channel family protein [Bacillus sp. RO2]